jgi:hypothetical protein
MPNKHNINEKETERAAKIYAEEGESTVFNSPQHIERLSKTLS